MLLHWYDYFDYIDPAVNASRGKEQNVVTTAEHFEIAFSDHNETGAACLRAQVRDLKE